MYFKSSHSKVSLPLLDLEEETEKKEFKDGLPGSS